MNKKGQALVEFIIVIPVLLLVILAVFDVINIYQKKIELESTIEDVILDDSYLLPSGIDKEENTTSGKKTITLSSSISITSPFLKPVLEDPYKVVVSRTINE